MSETSTTPPETLSDALRAPGAWWRWSLVAGCTLAMIYFMAVVNPPKSETVGWFAQLMERFNLPKWLPAKGFHFLSYACWAFFLLGALGAGFGRLLAPRLRVWFYAATAAYICIPESLQGLGRFVGEIGDPAAADNPVVRAVLTVLSRVLATSRTPAVMDLAINSAGAFVGSLLFLGLCRLRARRSA